MTKYFLMVLCLLFLLIQPVIFAEEFLEPSSIALDRNKNVYTRVGRNIYKFGKKGQLLNVINKKINDIYGTIDSNGKTSIDTILYVNGKRTGVAEPITRKGINEFSNYLHSKRTLKGVIEKVVYPEHITIGPDGDIYVVGKDIFRDLYKLAILDPSDGHPLSVFPAGEKEILKTRAERMIRVINKKKFEKKAGLGEFMLKNKEAINGFAGKFYLDKILSYVPYDKSYEEETWANLHDDKWANFRIEIIREWHKGEVVTPQGISADKEGNFYVTDYWDSKVKVFDKKGRFVYSFGDFGTDDGKFKAIRSITVDDKNNCIYITDNFVPSNLFGTAGQPFQMRVQKFTKDGKFILKWGSNIYKRFQWWPPQKIYHPELGEPKGIAINSKGEVYILTSYTGEVQKFTPEGKLIMKWGKRGKGLGEFDDPQAIVIDKYDNIYVADTDNNRIQKFDENGKFLMEIK